MYDNIFKFDEYLKEDSYTLSKDGITKNDLEIYKDFYPEKWLYINFSEQKQEQIFNTRYVWIIKYKNIIKSVLPDSISENKIKEIGQIILESEK